MIIRYTTPYHSFILPFLSEDIDKITVAYVQNGVEVLKKRKTDFTFIDIEDLLENASMGDENWVDLVVRKFDKKVDKTIAILHLDQEETALFNYFKAEEKNIVNVQFHVVNTEGNSFISRIIRMRVYNSISEEVL